jgi:glyoxylase-like metal-dependent hydrolase (beta-lactamase superfamily II)
MRSKILEPPDAFNDDTEQNRASIRKLAELGPSLILPGHGDAVRDMGAFERFVSTLQHGAGDGHAGLLALVSSREPSSGPADVKDSGGSRSSAERSR